MTKSASVFLRNPVKIYQGVYIYDANVFDDFESIYLTVRNSEQRILSDEKVLLLPETDVNYLYHKEWNIRKNSTSHFLNYLNHKQLSDSSILDIGCGNGWFSNTLAQIPNTQVVALDINLEELTQGARVFSSEQLLFTYADIYADLFQPKVFDLIVMNCMVQYFSDLHKIINRCLKLLSEHGELHIIDSPFYSHNQIQSAANRTSDYYRSINCEEMIGKYFHHCIDDINDYDYYYLYQPEVDRKNKDIDTPFPWICIKAS